MEALSPGNSLRSFTVLLLWLAFDLAMKDANLRHSHDILNQQASLLLPRKHPNNVLGLSDCGGGVLLFHTPLTLKMLDLRSRSLASISGFQEELVACIWHFLDLGTSLNSLAHWRGQPIPLFAVFRELDCK